MKRILLLMVVSLSFASLSFAQIYTQDFEGMFPDGWTAEGEWNWGNEAANSSQFFTFTESDGTFMAVNDDALGQGVDGSGSLYSDMIDLTAEEPGNYLLSLDYFFLNGDYQDADETLKILISDDGGSTWTEIFNAESTLNDAETAILWNRANLVLEEAGGNMLQLQFEYRDGGQWNYGAGIDNVSISGIRNYDATVNGITVARYTDIDDASSGATLSVSNIGTATIETMMLDVTINGEASTTEVTGLSVAQFETVQVSLEDIGITDPIQYVMDISVSSINGEADENMSDNATSTLFFGVADSPKRNTVAEEATGTWCVWCPRGAVFMEFMKENYPDDFVGIAVHNNDPMAVTEYDAGLTSVPGFLGFPSVPMDRVAVIDPSELEAFHLANTSRTSPASVDFEYEYDETSRLVTVNATVTAHTSLRDVHRLALVVTEDEVSSTDAGYAQANAYAGGGQGAMGGYENLPDPVPASQMIYEDVARAIVGGFTGREGSVSDTEFGGTSTYTFQYIMPANVDDKHVSLSVLAIDSETQETLNAVKKKMEFVSSVTDVPTEINEISIYPNPATSEAFLNLDLNESSDVRIALVNTMGQIVAQNTHYSVNGNQMFPIVRNDLPSGTYMVQVAINDKVVSKRVTFVD